MARKTKQPTAKVRPHQKTVVLRMEIGKKLLREPQASSLIAQFAKDRIDEFKLREGLDGNADKPGDQKTD